MTALIMHGDDDVLVSYNADDDTVYIDVDNGWLEITVTVAQAKKIAGHILAVLTP